MSGIVFAAIALHGSTMPHGALGDGWRPELLAYEAPTYVGMLCADFQRSSGG